MLLGVCSNKRINSTFEIKIEIGLIILTDKVSTRASNAKITYDIYG